MPVGRRMKINIAEMHERVEQVIAASAPKVTYAGGAMGGSGFLLNDKVIGLLGLVIAVAGFLVNWHYKRKDDKRRQVEHEARMAERGFYEQG